MRAKFSTDMNPEKPELTAEAAAVATMMMSAVIESNSVRY